MTRSRGIAAIGCALLLAVAAGPAAAANEFEVSKYGARIGFSSDPDQFTIGMFAALGELAPRLSMRPSVDLGFGDDVLSVILNADIQYSFVIGSAVAPYLGTGLGLAYYSFDVPAGSGVDDTDTEIGINIYGGAEMDMGGYRSLFLEARLGIDDLPDFKLTAGLGFY